MEVEKLVRVQSFLVLAIQLTVFAGICSYMHSCLATTEGGKTNSASDIKSQTTSSVPCLERYITNLYFEKHDSLIDSDFHNFIANELPLRLSSVLLDKVNLAPKLSVLQRYLIGEGSHRRLSSSMRLSLHLESIHDLPKHTCKIIIIERLPSGIFADPFELQHLLQRGVFIDAAVFGDTNLELPSVASNRSVVEVHVDAGLSLLSGHNNGLEVNVELPLHARYQPLGESGFSRVEFGKPDLFIQCDIEGKSHDPSCFLMQSENVSECQKVVWEIPCGIKEHAEVVSTVTFISAVVSASLIVLTSNYYPRTKKSAAI